MKALRDASLIPTDVADADTCTTGYLTKQGGKYKSWRKRYFVLEGKMLCVPSRSPSSLRTS